MIKNEDEKAGNEAAEIGRAAQLVKPAHNMKVDSISILCRIGGVRSSTTVINLLRRTINELRVDCIDR